MSYEYQPSHLQIYKAVFHDNWYYVSNIFEAQSELQTEPISRRLETPLMIAVGTNRSHKFVKRLLSNLSDRNLISSALAAENYNGDTALHYAAKSGNMIDAKLLVSYSSKPEMALHQNNQGMTPLIYASSFGRKKEMIEFLYSLTVDVLGSHISGIPTDQNLFLRTSGLLANAIDARFLDIALKLVESYSIKRNKWDLQQSLDVLARRPELFPTGNTLGFWQHCIYKLLPVHTSKVISDEKTSQQDAQDEEAVYVEKEFSYNTYRKRSSTTTCIKRIFRYLASPIKKIYDLKRTHKQTEQLVNHICNIVVEKSDQDIVCAIFGSTISTAVEYGNFEVLSKCVSTYPSVIWTNEFEELELFHEAIKQRQEKVYNLVYKISSYKSLVLSHVDSKTNENALHIAAKLAPPHRLDTITGAALQMQRELQWFQEIESYVEPSLKGALNKDGETPRMVFNKEHKELLKEGKEWMKDTASSSSVVATLIVTVAFAAVFEDPPGGEKSEGTIAFMIFVISDAIALFSSATSALLFLGILTSRYAQEDFLDVLPRRLMGGLFTLFLSLAAIMIAFSATLALVLGDNIKWIAAPLVIVTSIPVGLFVLIQFPLLIELVKSTYGPDIFPKKQERMTH